MRQEDWLPATKGWGYVLGSPIRQPETCPGYTTQLPAVVEAVRAWGWWDKSQLSTRYPEFDALLHRLVESCNQEVRAADAWHREEQERRRSK